MGIIEIINIIMAILAFISGLFNPKTGVRTVAYVSDYECTDAQWPLTPTVVGGEFRGTVEVVCEFEAHGHGGLRALRAHYLRQLPEDALVHGEPRVVTHQGLPAIELDTTLELGDGATARGTTHIATNGFTVLHNVFNSSQIVSPGHGRFLQSVQAEYIVRPTIEPGIYQLRSRQSLRVRKPVLAPTASFRQAVVQQSEQSIMERAVGAIQDMALHL